jgi:hypothetical protein
MLFIVTGLFVIDVVVVVPRTRYLFIICKADTREVPFSTDRYFELRSEDNQKEANNANFPRQHFTAINECLWSLSTPLLVEK